MVNQQLELSLEARRQEARRRARRSGAPAARWWFDRMRQVVDLAMDFPHGAPEGRRAFHSLSEPRPAR